MIYYLVEQLRDLILPPMCGFCKIFLEKPAQLCEHCASKIHPIVSLTVPLSTHYDMTVFAISAYQDPLKALILAKSYSNIIASRQLGHLMWEFTTISHMSFDYIVPVPLHWTRRVWRGFNQAHEIAKILGARSGKPVIELLARSKRTQFQAALGQQQRHLNVKDAFIVQPDDISKYQGKHLLLVDDLFTTGSTLREAARELTALKPASIKAVVACRVI